MDVAACFSGLWLWLSSVLVSLIPDEVPSAAIQISQQLLTCVFGFCFLLSFDEIKPIASINDLYLFALMGFCGGIGVLCIVISYRLATPSSVSVFEYFGIPISFILGWLFFRESTFLNSVSRRPTYHWCRTVNYLQRATRHHCSQGSSKWTVEALFCMLRLLH